MDTVRGMLDGFGASPAMYHDTTLPQPPRTPAETPSGEKISRIQRVQGGGERIFQDLELGKSTFTKNATSELKSYARLGAESSKHLVVVRSTLGTKLLVPPLARISPKRVRFWSECQFGGNLERLFWII